MSTNKNILKHFENKKVLITGNTGFKGSWLSMFLSSANAKIYGLSRDVRKDKAFSTFRMEHQFVGDVCDFEFVKRVIDEIQPDFVFHMAAEAITLKSFQSPRDTFNVNAMGTVNILESIRLLGNKVAVIAITSDKCYQNNEWVWGYRENDNLGGIDPYSASKSMAELAVKSYYESFFKQDDRVAIVSCRAGNVIGGGDWGEMRIIPDCVRAWKDGESLLLRSPHAVRPWNYVLDLIYGYLLAAVNIYTEGINGEAFNFGPQLEDAISVEELVKKFWNSWGGEYFNPFSMNKDKSARFEHKMLKLYSDKAHTFLGWKSTTPIEEALDDIAKWYKEYLNSPDEIDSYSFDLIQKFLNNIHED